MADRKDLLTSVSVIDPSTGHMGLREYTYFDGKCVGGVCYGFEEVVATEFVHDPAIHQTGGQPELQARSETTTHYWLDRDFAVPTSKSINISSANPVPASNASQTLDWGVYRTQYGYDQLQFFSGDLSVDLGVLLVHPWVVGVETTETAHPVDVVLSGDNETRSTRVSLVRDAETGAVTDSYHQAAPALGTFLDDISGFGTHIDDSHLHTDYAWNTDNTQQYPTVMSTTAFDHEASHGELGEVGQVANVVDDRVASVMGSPATIQGSPSSFFNVSCCSESIAMTSSFRASFFLSRVFSAVRPRSLELVRLPEVSDASKFSKACFCQP